MQNTNNFPGNLGSMKYVYDCFTAQTSNKTFSIEPHLSLRTEKEDSPYKIFDDSFSRFVFNIVTKGVGGVKINVPVELIPGIIENSRIAARLQMELATTPSAGGNSPAFSKRFIAGSLRGKTPVDVLMEDPEGGKKRLNRQYTWLKDNLPSHPENKEYMEAISEAAKIDLSAVSAGDIHGRKPATILNIGTRPLVRKKKENGKAFVYEGKITWDFARNYPVNITIENYYAPVIEKDDGMMNVKTSEKEDSVRYEFSLTSDVWMAAVKKMESILTVYEMIYLPKVFHAVDTFEEEQRDRRQANG